MFEYAKLGSRQEPMKDVMEDVAARNKEDDNVPMLQPPAPQSIPPRVHPSVESAEVTGGTMEMEPGTNTLSNPSLENAESSCKSLPRVWKWAPCDFGHTPVV
ncbi:hypothetical protein OIU85_012924 [Salix viminalis]|uniref:Uncharacterized protein n=1 Tax=Salix viminalis TaxID=40686 RepID=A0A9Q0NQ96_SALVM|nr:hypothetical protein OIU85_012924 [Salix viminalis]